MLLLGVVYLVILITFGTFAGSAASNSMRVLWNRLAFVASGIVFAIHIGYEHFHFGNSPRITALHAALASAAGAFGLALVANIHDLQSASGYRPRMLIAFLAWPLLTSVPAFIVALVVAAGLTLRRRRSSNVS